MPNSTEPISLRAEFSEATLRAAIGALVKETFRSSLRLSVAMALIAACCLIAILAGVSMGGLLTYAAFGAICASIFWGAAVAINYRVTLAQCIRLFREMPTRAVEYEVTGSGIAVTSAAWSGVIPWSAVRRIVRRPSLVLVGLGKALISQVKPEQVHVRSAIGEETLPSAALITLWRFPLLWSRPGMTQLFLVIQRAAGDETLVTAIADGVRTQDHISP